MSIENQPGDRKGSLRAIQKLINDHPALLNQKIKEQVPELTSFKWKSPLSPDFAEYRDQDFLDLLGITTNQVPLKAFWPSKGPRWDGLGLSDNTYFLIEAKANTPEIISSPSAAGEKSLCLINKSLSQVKTYLDIDNDVIWSGKYYQYTNRIAHLYFLRVLNDIPTYLINVYFINDESVGGPKTIHEWEVAIELMKSYLGIKRHKLSKYMIDIFIDTKMMR